MIACTNRSWSPLFKLLEHIYFILKSTDENVFKEGSRYCGNGSVIGRLIIFANKPNFAQFFLICLFIFSTCFGQPCAHNQEN